MPPANGRRNPSPDRKNELDQTRDQAHAVVQSLQPSQVVAQPGDSLLVLGAHNDHSYVPARAPLAHRSDWNQPRAGSKSGTRGGKAGQEAAGQMGQGEPSLLPSRNN